MDTSRPFVARPKVLKTYKITELDDQTCVVERP